MSNDALISLENAFYAADAAYKAAIQKWHNAKGTPAELDALYLAATKLRAKAGQADDAWQDARRLAVPPK